MKLDMAPSALYGERRLTKSSALRQLKATLGDDVARFIYLARSHGGALAKGSHTHSRDYDIYNGYQRISLSACITR